MAEAVSHLRQLRLHCNGGYEPCPGCDPVWGVYCPDGQLLAERFYLARRREVLVERDRQSLRETLQEIKNRVDALERHHQGGRDPQAASPSCVAAEGRRT